MKKILVGGLALLVGVLIARTAVVTAQVNSNDPRIALVDNCDPTTFDAAIGPGTCAPTPQDHNTTFAQFAGLLFSPLVATVVGHPGWNFAPGYVAVHPGQTVRITNVGGEAHTFTEVSDFGGGFVPLLNGAGGPAGTVPLVPAAGCTAAPIVVAPGQTVRVSGLSAGTHKFQCCIHPWMRAVVNVQ